MSAGVAVGLLRDPRGVGAAARFLSGLRCARCDSEGYSPRCPNCLGVSSSALGQP